MLYLMLDKRGEQYFAKVGLAKAPSRRRSAYKTHNPCAIMRSTCAGTESAENSAHYTLGRSAIRRVNGTEWFEVSAEVFAELYEKGMGYIRPNQKPIHFIEKFEEG